MRVIAVTNQKGGVGKTTTAVSLATGLAKIGYRTLLIDTDPQCNSTDTYRAVTDGEATLYDMLCEGERAMDCIQHTEVGDIIACDNLLKDAEKKLPAGPERCYIMKEQCSGLEELYDYVIIDTTPGLGVLLVNVLTYAQEIIIPLTCDRYALQGIDELRKTIESAKKYTNPGLMIRGMLLNKYSGRKNLCKEVSEGLIPVSEMLGTKVFESKIREAADCQKSQSARMSIYDYNKRCTTAEDYMALCEEIVGDING